MLSIYRKEINAFFSSLIGYIAIVVFLVITGLIVWVFPDTNVLDYGYASLESLFFVAPWVYLFLIPAITMRSFAEEISNGTIEMLTTKPLRELDIILGKYFAALTLVLFSLLPTLIYYVAVYELGAPKGNLDSGAIWGSYLGLMFLGSAFVAMGMFASSITSNQIVSFVLAAFLCFFFHWSFDFLSGLELFYAKIDDLIEAFGINAHYISISRGVVDTRDLAYFISFTAIFILLTKTVLESRKWK